MSEAAAAGGGLAGTAAGDFPCAKSSLERQYAMDGGSLSSKTEATVSAMAGLSEEALRDTYTRISRAAVALRQELEEQQQLLLLHARQRRVLDAELAELKGRVVLPPLFRIWSDGDATPEQDSTRIADVPALQKAVCRRGSNARAGAGGVSTLAAAEVNVSGASSPLPPSPHSATEDCVIVAAEILVGSRSLPLRLAATESCEEAAAAWVDRHWGALQKHWRAGCPAATFLGRNKAIESLESFLRNVEETSEELPVKVTRSWSLILDPQSEKQLN
ncbi:hypothetical protein cyc_01477 [Cyclospora cayetanensis]|uniref:Uncharacterized protein n=1 Tax=Cyclospora cayetanensis TaxID=88456 RepID=A0A1D3D6U4_9EIME|nr:hypothetical protein cyc_01477 [Cyclospora cayetanensis]